MLIHMCRLILIKVVSASLNHRWNKAGCMQGLPAEVNENNRIVGINISRPIRGG